MVAKVLDDNKPIKSLKSLFALFQTSPVLFDFIQFGKSWQHFHQDRIYPYINLDKDNDNFCVVFTYSIMQAHEIKMFHVVQCNGGKEILLFAILLAVAVVVSFVVIQK